MIGLTLYNKLMGQNFFINIDDNSTSSFSKLHSQNHSDGLRNIFQVIIKKFKLHKI